MVILCRLKHRPCQKINHAKTSTMPKHRPCQNIDHVKKSTTLKHESCQKNKKRLKKVKENLPPPPSVSNYQPLELPNAMLYPLHRKHYSNHAAMNKGYLSFDSNYLRDEPRNLRIKGINTHHKRPCTIQYLMCTGPYIIANISDMGDVHLLTL